MPKERGKRKTNIGKVDSNNMDKTIVVVVERSTKHPVYKKYIKKRKKFKAHDEENKCQVGDKVLIVETRPLSKEKCWRVREIIGKAV